MQKTYHLKISNGDHGIGNSKAESDFKPIVTLDPASNSAQVPKSNNGLILPQISPNHPLKRKTVLMTQRTRDKGFSQQDISLIQSNEASILKQHQPSITSLQSSEEDPFHMPFTIKLQQKKKETAKKRPTFIMDIENQNLDVSLDNQDSFDEKQNPIILTPKHSKKPSLKNQFYGKSTTTELKVLSPLKIQGSDDFGQNQGMKQTIQKVQSQRYRDPQAKTQSKLKIQERMFQSTLRNQTKTTHEHNQIPKIITDELSFQQSMISKHQDLFSDQRGQIQRIQLPQNYKAQKVASFIHKGQTIVQKELNHAYQDSDLGSLDKSNPNNLSLEDLSKNLLPGFPSTKATESTTMNSDHKTDNILMLSGEQAQNSDQSARKKAISKQSTYDLLVQQQKALHDRIQQILQIQCSNASIISQDQAAAIRSAQQRASSLESGSQKMSDLSKKYIVPDSISYKGKNPHFADFNPQNKALLYKQVQRQMLAGNNQFDLVERLNQSKEKIINLNIFQKQFDQSKYSDKRFPLASNQQFTAPNTLQFPPPINPVKMASEKLPPPNLNQPSKDSRNKILIQYHNGQIDNSNPTKKFMRNMTNPLQNPQNQRQFKNQFSVKKSTKPLLTNVSMQQTFLQNQLPPPPEQTFTKFEQFLMDINETQNVNQAQMQNMKSLSPNRSKESAIMNQTVGTSPTRSKESNDLKTKQHKMQELTNANQEQKINLNSTYYKDATPFTGYLTREFLKQNEYLRERQRSYQNRDESEMSRIRQIQIQTIKDLEDCLRDYERTENALAELQTLNHNHTSPKKQVIAKHLQIYDKQVKRANQLRRDPKQKKDASGVMSFLHSNHPAPMQETNIKIHHPFDSSEHFNHPINICLRNHNFIIRMLFKNTKDQQSLISSLQHQQSHNNQDPTSQQQHQSQQDLHLKPSHQEDLRLKQIADIAHFMHIPLPKRFSYDSKQAIREFIQSRSFITQMKLQLSQQIQDCVNKANGTYGTIKKRQQRWQQQQDLIKERVMEKRKVNDPQVYSNVGGENEGDDHRGKKKDKGKKKKVEAKQEAPSIVNGSPLQLRVKFPESEAAVDFQQRYYIGQGNNHNVVKQMIKNRYWWQQAQNEDLSDACFVWTCWKKDKHINYIKKKNQAMIAMKDETKWQNLKVYSRIDNNKQLTNKKGIFFNMLDYYKRIGSNPFDVLPTTYLVSSVNEPEFRKFEMEYNRISQLIKDNKIKMEKELWDFNNKKQEQKNDVLNQINFQSSEEKKQEDKDDENKIQAIRHKYRSPQNTWILKPGENSNRGCGINVLHSLNEIRSQVSSLHGSGEKTMIIQKYIDYPLLINKRKFDFRVFGLVTSINSNLKGYFYEDGYIRTSSREFNLNDLSDKFVHLTNDAIQKQADDFGKFENFNKMSYQDFQKYLNANYSHLNIDVTKHIIPQIKKLITDTYKSVCFKIDPMRLNNTFEILGYDFMIDDDFKLSLIEVNTNPCLETDSPLLSRIIPELIEASFKLVLDPIFPCPDMSQRFKQFMNQLPQEIKFQLVFDEMINGPELAKVFGINWQQFRDNALGVGLKDLNSDMVKETENDDEEITCK